MNVETDRRTKAVFVARSRSHRLVDMASRSFRATLILRTSDVGLRRLRIWHEPSSSEIRNPRSAVSQQSLDETAVDLHRRARHVRRGIREQKRADAAELVWRAIPADRHRRSRPFSLFLGGDSRLSGVDLV